jgi:hypothetical protein
MKNYFLLRISIVRLQLRWSCRKNPQRILDLGELSRVVYTPPVFSSCPPRVVKTLKIITTESFFITLLETAGAGL